MAELAGMQSQLTAPIDRGNAALDQQIEHQRHALAALETRRESRRTDHTTTTAAITTPTADQGTTTMAAPPH